MTIIELTSENFKRLKAVHITPNGSVVRISGKNAAGKSSVLDSIAAAMGGGQFACDMPVRQGEEKAKIIVRLEDMIITKVFNATGTASLTVTNDKGAKYGSPQAMLDKLVGRLCFDPLAFTRMDDKKQLETLKNLVGLDFSNLDGERIKFFNERTEVNRDVKSLQSRLDAIPFHKDIGVEEKSVAELVNTLKRANAKKKERDDIETAVRDAQADIDSYHKQTGEIKDQIALLQKELANMEGAIQNLKTENNARIDSLDKMEVPDTTKIEADISGADAFNNMARQNKQRAELDEAIANKSKKAEELTASIQKVEARKQAAMQAAEFPVDGLAFNEEGVLYNGIPFSQASSAEKLRVSLAMGIAMNPTLKVLLIRDASLLDENGMKVVAEMAEKSGSQVWIETVSDDTKVGIVIEDGMVAADNSATKEAAVE